MEHPWLVWRASFSVTACNAIDGHLIVCKVHIILISEHRGDGLMSDSTPILIVDGDTTIFAAGMGLFPFCLTRLEMNGPRTTEVFAVAQMADDRLWCRHGRYRSSVRKDEYDLKLLQFVQVFRKAHLVLSRCWIMSFYGVKCLRRLEILYCHHHKSSAGLRYLVLNIIAFRSCLFQSLIGNAVMEI